MLFYALGMVMVDSPKTPILGITGRCVCAQFFLIVNVWKFTFESRKCVRVDCIPRQVIPLGNCSHIK